MFFQTLLGLVVVVLGDVRMYWGETARQSVTLDASSVSVDGVERCVDSGREARFRFEMRGCRRRVGWFDSCGKESIWTKTVQYDPITESFKLVTDMLDDDGDPVSVGIPNRQEAFRKVTLLEAIPLGSLTVGGKPIPDASRGYFAARVIFQCKGLVSRTWSRLSTALTFGLVDVGFTDTGWRDFDPQMEVAGAEKQTPGPVISVK